jgi:hypothetical protein
MSCGEEQFRKERLDDLAKIGEMVKEIGKTVIQYESFLKECYDFICYNKGDKMDLAERIKHALEKQ